MLTRLNRHGLRQLVSYETGFYIFILAVGGNILHSVGRVN